MEMQFTFPGGSRVDASFKDFVVSTDQPARNGGDNTAPSPFDYFLASIGTCAGFYAHKFLEQRQLSTAGLSLALRTTHDKESGMIREILLSLSLPADFPAKYRQAIVNAINQCSVKKHLEHPPEFRTEVAISESPRTAETAVV